MKFALCSTVFLALLSAPAIAQDFVLFKTFGNDVPLNGNAKGTFSWGVIDGNSSTAEVVDAPVGAEPDSLAYTMKGGTAGTKGIALYVGDLDVEYDISPYSYVNFYVKVPAGAGAREWTLNLRERGAAGRSSGDAPRGEGAIGAWNTHPGFVEGEWSYISVPFTALAPTDGDAGNPVPFSGDFSLFTDLWIYNNAGIPAGDDLVVNFDYFTFSTTPEAGMLEEEEPVGLPVAGVFGLMALAVGLAAGGTAAVRRKTDDR